jgi:hypothetical protein
MWLQRIKCGCPGFLLRLLIHSGILQVTVQEIQHGVKQVHAGFFAADTMLAARVGHHLERYDFVLQRLE